MKNKELPSGQMEQFIAHTNPIKSEPLPTIIERKQAQTLMSNCLKQFIRERMYGNLINYSRRKNSTHEAGLSSLLPKIRTVKQRSYGSVLDIREVQKKRKSTIQKHNRYLQSNENQKTELLVLKKRCISSLEKKYLQTTKRKYDFISEGSRKDKQKSKQNQRDLCQNKQISDVRSFISAIQDQQYSINKKLEIESFQKIRKEGDQSKMFEKHERQKKIKNQQFISIKKEFWLQFCIEEKNNLITMNTEKKQQKSGNSKSNFSKEVFLNYLTRRMEVSCIPLLQAYNFFQMNKKIKDKMNIDDYIKTLKKMFQCVDRVWAFFAFRYWDKDKNGLISNNDIFQAYKQIDALKEKIKQNKQSATLQINIAIQEMNETLNRLHMGLVELQRDKECDLNQLSQNDRPEKKSEDPCLQQSFLSLQRISYSDLQMILGKKMKEEKQIEKHSVIQSVEGLGLKFSSCYRYSFLATDHNQVTRQNRQCIENIKESLKIRNGSQRKQNKKYIKSLTYQQFLKGKYFMSLKNQIKKAFGIVRDGDEK